MIKVTNGRLQSTREPVIRGVNDLATTNPEVIKLWSDKNGELKPSDIRATYKKQVWWICQQCSFEYQAQPRTVIKKLGQGCIRCQSTIGKKWKGLMTDEERIKEEYR